MPRRPFPDDTSLDAQVEHQGEAPGQPEQTTKDDSSLSNLDVDQPSLDLGLGDMRSKSESDRQATIIHAVMRGRRLNLTESCLLALTVLSIFYTLYLASEIVLPFVFAVVVNLMMITPMRFLNRHLGCPKVVAALLLIVLMFVLVAGIGTAISVPAAAWLTKVPQSLPALKEKLSFLHGPIESLQLGYARTVAMVSSGSHHHINLATSVSSSLGRSVDALRNWGSSFLLGTRAFMGQFFTMLLVLFFLMTKGDSLLRRFVEIMPSYAEKKRLVKIATQVERNVSLYLATITVMNLFVGLLNLVQCWLTGMPNHLLWGVLAFLLNYVPILGPLTCVVVYFCVAVISFSTFLPALLPPAIYLAIHVLEGETITPLLLAKRFTLNPVLVISSLLFWDWMWGIGGAFLSVPLLAVSKIICDHIHALSPIGHLLGGAVKPRKTLKVNRSGT